MFVFQIQQTGQTELQIGFQKLLDEFQDWHSQFELLEPESEIVMVRRFEQEGPGWLELKPATVAYKAQHFPGKTILRRTDALFLSFQKGNADNFVKIDALSAEFGSTNPYGRFQPNTRLIVDISDSDEERFLQVATIDKTERFRELGFDIQ
jgi:hypothetical protein